MKNIVFLYAGIVLSHAFDILFPAENTSDSPVSESAFGRALEWAKKIDDCSRIVIAACKSREDCVKREIIKHGMEADCEVVTEESWSPLLLLRHIAESAKADGASYIVYSSADRPFLDLDLTRHIISDHLKYLAEYTFADGYPAGFAPEVLDCGTANILLALASKKEKYSSCAVDRDSIYNVIKEDINSFEIEAVIAPVDYRMLRLDFSCSSKAKTLACQSLYKTAVKDNASFDAKSLSDVALASPEVQQTVPAFYNVQIAENLSTRTIYNPYPEAFKSRKGFYPDKKENADVKNMSLDSFRQLIDGIAAFSETAVVSLSGLSEPLTVPNFLDYLSYALSKPGISVFVETDGTLLTAPLAQKASKIVEDSPNRTGDWPAVIWVVQLDAVSEEKYNSIHTNAFTNANGIRSFDCAKNALVTLQKYFPGDVYPQFVRMKDNEDELEKFYRFYHDSDSPSKGKLIIQKYDSFCALLPDLKVADLTPVERNPCWHIKRDMTILPDGNVPLCREYVFENVIGNVFAEGIPAVWKKTKDLVQSHINKQYPEKCGCCDEYYTFNF